MTKPFLSIIFPAHNEERRLPATLEQTAHFLETQSYPAEVIVVENGSQDATLQVANSFLGRCPNLQVIHEDRRGKGLAVQRGMLAAHGTYRIFCDVDLSMPIDEVNRFIPPALSNPAITIASRELPGSVRYGEPVHRHLVGRVFNTLVRWAILPGLEDTQCGFKCFREDVVENIFPLQTLPGMSFDVELLYIARLHGYPIQEIAIPWYFNADSRVRLVEDSLRMGSDLVAIRQNARRGRYGPAV